MKAWFPSLVVPALLSFAGFASAAQGLTGGTPFLGPVGVHATVDQIMTYDKTFGPRSPRETEIEKELPDRSTLPARPGGRDLSQWPAPIETGMNESRTPPVVTSPQTVGVNFTAATLFGTNPTFSFPPDCMGDIGPTQYVVMVNDRLVTFDKTTGLADGVLNASTDAFFASVGDGSFTTDPRIRYDRFTGRWFLVMITSATPNRLMIAVTDAASNGTITGSTVFTFFSVNTATVSPPISSSCFMDYPTLGVDVNALYIGGNVFCGGFNSTDGYVVRKSSILGAGPMVLTVFRGMLPSAGADGEYTPQGVDNFDPAATEGYFIGVSNAFFGELVLRRVTDPAGTPSISSDFLISTTLSTSLPIRVPHLGNTGGAAGQLSALDDRLFQAVLRNGHLWTAHNIGVTNTGSASGTRTRNGARWYDLTGVASPGTPAVFQSGTVFTPSATNVTTERHYWIPSVMVSGQGHAALALSSAGTSARADAATVGRLANDGLGSMGTPVLYTSSAFAYNPPSDPGSSQGRRWGDYSYVGLDPLDDMTMWAVQMFADQTNSYGVRVAQLIAPPPATPASAPDVEAGHASQVVTLTGTSSGGSGFYDPGANLPGGVPAFRHLSAVVTNAGVTGNPPTVNSATYLTPTTVQLDLNTTAADPNLPAEKYNVAITNPDGQIATGLQVLRVNAPATAVLPGGGDRFLLESIRPNPSTGPTEIGFTVGREAHVQLTVVDLQGREVALLADGIRAPGRYVVAWDGRHGGEPAAAGVYFVHYRSEGREQVRRMALTP